MAGVYMNTIECTVCGPSHQSNSQQLEYSISLPLLRPRPSLDALLTEHFSTESVSEYICMRCTLTDYLRKQSNKTDPEFRAGLEFIASLKDLNSMDKETFLQKFSEFQKNTGNKSQHKISFVKRKIMKWQRLLKPPVSQDLIDCLCRKCL